MPFHLEDCSVFGNFVITLICSFIYRKYIPEMYYKNTSVISIFLLKMDDIQVLLEMKENVFYVTWMYWRTNSIFFCNLQSRMICAKKNIKKYYWSFKLVQLLSAENRKELCNLGRFIHLACKARNDLVWLTCVFVLIVLTFLTYLCYFLICHTYIYDVQSCYYNMPHCLLMNCYVQS